MVSVSFKFQVFLEYVYHGGVTLEFSSLKVQLSVKSYLDGLLVQVLLLAGDEVRSHDSALLSGGDLAGKDTAEGVEPSLVGGRHHLGDVHHEGGLGVTVLDTHAGNIVGGSLIQKLGSRNTIISKCSFLVSYLS